MTNLQENEKGNSTLLPALGEMGRWRPKHEGMKRISVSASAFAEFKNLKIFHSFFCGRAGF